MSRRYANAIKSHPEFPEGAIVRPNADYRRVYPRSRMRAGKVIGGCLLAGRLRVLWDGTPQPVQVDVRLVERDE